MASAISSFQLSPFSFPPPSVFCPPSSVFSPCPLCLRSSLPQRFSFLLSHFNFSAYGRVADGFNVQNRPVKCGYGRVDGSSPLYATPLPVRCLPRRGPAPCPLTSDIWLPSSAPFRFHPTP